MFSRVVHQFSHAPAVNNFSFLPSRASICHPVLFFPSLTGVKRNLKLVLICISLMAKGVENLKKYISEPFVFRLLRTLYLVLCTILNRVVFLMFELLNFLYSLDTNPQRYSW